jgi:serine protease inhibitor
MSGHRLFPPIAAFVILIAPGKIVATDASRAANATNEIGLDLYRKLASGDDNLCLSPYAIENALAMTLAGADGQTREEMARVLHAQATGESVHASFGALRRALADLVEQSIKRAAEIKKHGYSEEPIMLAIASRLFAQRGFDFRDGFIGTAKEHYGTPVEPVDYVNAAQAATGDINSWVAEQTHGRIRDLVPAGALDAQTRLVLVNAIYLKAPWASPFSAEQTQPQPFRVRGEAAVKVPTMFAHEGHFGYAKREDYAVVSVSYSGSDLQFLIFLPDDAKGFHAFEKKISAAILANAARLKSRQLDLYLPKFKLELPALDLGATLQTLGMRTAFDHPQGSANFERMAPRKVSDYLFLSAVFHKTFIAVDEVGTEAAAADALPVTVYSAELLRKKPKPLVVKVDRPFVYAIQHVPSGTCLFLGRVTDPR